MERNNGSKFNQTQLRINPNELEKITCDNCEGNIFVQGFNLSIIPALLSPNGQPAFAFVSDKFVCVTCGRVYTNQELTEISKNGGKSKDKSKDKSKIIDITKTNEEKTNEDN